MDRSKSFEVLDKLLTIGTSVSAKWANEFKIFHSVTSVFLFIVFCIAMIIMLCTSYFMGRSAYILLIVFLTIVTDLPVF